MQEFIAQIPQPSPEIQAITIKWKEFVDQFPEIQVAAAKWKEFADQFHTPS